MSIIINFRAEFARNREEARRIVAYMRQITLVDGGALDDSRKAIRASMEVLRDEGLELWVSRRSGNF